MTNYDHIKKMNIDEMSIFLADIDSSNSPWIQWFKDKYCKKHESIKLEHGAVEDVARVWLDLEVESGNLYFENEHGAKCTLATNITKNKASKIIMRFMNVDNDKDIDFCSNVDDKCITHYEVAIDNKKFKFLYGKGDDILCNTN